jgi:type III restriction enzyme
VSGEGARCDFHLFLTSFETKGQENIDVAHKDRAATIWCENATLLTDTTWVYCKIPQVEFGKLQPTMLCDAVLAFAGTY